jgi:hypothetical protein
VLCFDVLAAHASRHERLTITRENRLTLLSMGVLTGLMGAAPSLVWASGTLFAAAFVVLVPLAVWLYTMVFAFSSLWFAHFALSALAALRRSQGEWVVDAAPVAAVDVATPINARPAPPA